MLGTELLPPDVPRMVPGESWADTLQMGSEVQARDWLIKTWAELGGRQPEGNKGSFSLVSRHARLCVSHYNSKNAPKT